jgi:hypothetical protein
MKPQPWSHSRLESFINCPRSFYEKTVAKSVVETQGKEAKWGEYVHKVFENYQRGPGSTLPAELASHLPFMKKIQDWQGTPGLEEKIALNRRLEPCDYFDQEVWYRGIIDFRKNIGSFSRLVDYKTGKVHNKFGQLRAFSLWVFAKFPEVDTVFTHYYWTKTGEPSMKMFHRSQIPQMWAEFIPDLKQYKEAFVTDTWQPRQSGLCRGWCPVQTCEFWSPGRN